MAIKQEKNGLTELTGGINSHAQFETEGIQVILSPKLPNLRCTHCATVKCEGKHPEETKDGCPNFQSRRNRP